MMQIVRPNFTPANVSDQDQEWLDLMPPLVVPEVTVLPGEKGQDEVTLAEVNIGHEIEVSGSRIVTQLAVSTMMRVAEGRRVFGSAIDLRKGTRHRRQ